MEYKVNFIKEDDNIKTVVKTKEEIDNISIEILDEIMRTDSSTENSSGYVSLSMYAYETLMAFLAYGESDNLYPDDVIFGYKFIVDPYQIEPVRRLLNPHDEYLRNI